MNKNSTELNNTKPSQGNVLPKLWTKSYILTLITMSVISFTMTFFMPLLPIYIKLIGGDISLAGIVVSVYTFTALVFRPVFAVTIDKYGRKPILIIGSVLILAGCFFYQFATLIGALMIIRVIHGIGYSAGSNAAGTIAADIVPRERRSQGIGFFGFITASSLALGPAIGLLIMKNTNIKTAFAAASVIAAVGLFAGCFITYEKNSVNKEVKTRKTKFSIGYEKTAYPAALIILLVAFAYSGVVTFLPAYAGSLGISNISIFFIIYAAALLITRICVDRITKKRDVSVVLLPGIVVMTISFILLGVGKTLPCFLIAAAFFGVGFGSIQPTLNTIVVSLCEPSRRGAANATFFSGMDLGIGLGALSWGVVSQIFGYPAVYFGCIAFMAFAAIAVIVLLRKNERFCKKGKAK